MTVSKINQRQEKNMSNKIERRFITAEVRIANDETDNGTITGYAALYFNGDKKNQSSDLGGFRERLEKGCFTRALAKGGDIKGEQRSAGTASTSGSV
jgi:phage head maturation protease